MLTLTCCSIFYRHGNKYFDYLLLIHRRGLCSEWIAIGLDDDDNDYDDYFLAGNINRTFLPNKLL